MANLYELTTDLRNVEILIAQDEQEGKPLDECLTQALDSLKGEVSAKVLNIGAWLKNLDSESAAIRAEEQALAMRRRSKEALQERLKAWVLKNIEAGNKFEDARCAVSTRKSQRVEVTKPATLPSEFVRTTVVQTPDKEAIKKAIKSGQAVPGATLIESLDLTVK